MTTLLDVFASPELYPIKIDFLRQVVSFWRMSQASYRRSNFLDERAYRSSSEFFEVSLDDLLMCSSQAPASYNRVAYVFHSAYCCSTLLARYLELIPGCFVLKEPRLLTQVAVSRPGLSALQVGSLVEASALKWKRVFDLCIRLLARAYGADEVVIVKANDRCNALGKLLLECNDRSRAIFLSIALRTFLLSVLKTQKRREWLRERLRVGKKDAASFPVLAGIDPRQLGDAEAGAYLWMLNDALCRQLCFKTETSRAMALDGEEIAESPHTALRAVACHFELPLDSRELKYVLTHPSIGRYSKDLSVAYDVNSRRREMIDLEKRFCAEADLGIAWAVNHGATDLTGFS